MIETRPLPSSSRQMPEISARPLSMESAKGTASTQFLATRRTSGRRQPRQRKPRRGPEQRSGSSRPLPAPQGRNAPKADKRQKAAAQRHHTNDVLVRRAVCLLHETRRQPAAKSEFMYPDAVHISSSPVPSQLLMRWAVRDQCSENGQKSGRAASGSGAAAPSSLAFGLAWGALSCPALIAPR